MTALGECDTTLHSYQMAKCVPMIRGMEEISLHLGYDIYWESSCCTPAVSSPDDKDHLHFLENSSDFIMINCKAEASSPWCVSTSTPVSSEI